MTVITDEDSIPFHLPIPAASSDGIARYASGGLKVNCCTSSVAMYQSTVSATVERVELGVLEFISRLFPWRYKEMEHGNLEWFAGGAGPIVGGQWADDTEGAKRSHIRI